MGALHPDTFAFLTDLAAHNDRDWFNANKSRYEAVWEAFSAFVEATTRRIAGFDPGVEGMTAKDSLMRIYRDVRFSKEKTPYQTHLGAHIVAGGRKAHERDRAGYFIRLEPGASILAGGAHLPPGPWAQAIRTRIDEDPDALREILAAGPFRAYFGEMAGDRMKSAPRGYARDHPAIDLLGMKSYLAVHQVPDAVALADDFAEHAGRVFEALAPFDRYLNGA
ncbi:MAG: DUF2461 domain-containing protein [Rhodothermales bacterium]